MTMTKCTGYHGAEHEPIEFEGIFTALCPFCAALQSAERSKQFEIDKLESEADDIREDMNRAEQNEKELRAELEAYRSDTEETIKELEAKIKELEKGK